MDKVDELVHALKCHGYVVLRFTPIQYRARGPLGYVDFWPLLNKYLPEYGGRKAMATDDLYATIKAMLQPFERMSDEQWEATEIWRQGLGDLYLQYPQLGRCWDLR